LPNEILFEEETTLARLVPLIRAGGGVGLRACLVDVALVAAREVWNAVASSLVHPSPHSFVGRLSQRWRAKRKNSGRANSALRRSSLAGETAPCPSTASSPKQTAIPRPRPRWWKESFGMLWWLAFGHRQFSCARWAWPASARARPWPVERRPAGRPGAGRGWVWLGRWGLRRCGQRLRRRAPYAPSPPPSPPAEAERQGARLQGARPLGRRAAAAASAPTLEPR
jgi:hypothetical protein